MNLGDSRFANVQDHSNFFHGQLFQVIQSEHLALFFVEFLDSPCEKSAHLGTQGELKGVFLGAARYRGVRFVASAVFGLCLQAAQVESPKLAEQLLILFEPETQSPGEFGFGRRAAKLRGKFAVCFFDASRLASQISRAPIHLAQTIENRSANSEPCVGFELDVLSRVEFVHRVDQTDDSGVDKIVEGNVRREPVVDSSRDVTHFREILVEQTLPLHRVKR